MHTYKHDEHIIWCRGCGWSGVWIYSRWGGRTVGRKVFPKPSQSLPKSPQSLPQASQSLPKASQSLPKGSQSLPKVSPEPSQGLPRLPQTTPRAPRWKPFSSRRGLFVYRIANWARFEGLLMILEIKLFFNRLLWKSSMFRQKNALWVSPKPPPSLPKGFPRGSPRLPKGSPKSASFFLLLSDSCFHPFCKHHHLYSRY